MTFKSKPLIFTSKTVDLTGKAPTTPVRINIYIYIYIYSTDDDDDDAANDDGKYYTYMYRFRCLVFNAAASAHLRFNPPMWNAIVKKLVFFIWIHMYLTSLARAPGADGVDFGTCLMIFCDASSLALVPASKQAGFGTLMIFCDASSLALGHLQSPPLRSRGSAMAPRQLELGL